MKKTDSLKAIERRAYRSTFSDGIYDIFFGVLFLILAWLPALEQAGIPSLYGYLLGAFLIPVALLGKRYITIPRLGAVEFGAKRKSKRWLLAAICAAIIFMIMPLLIMQGAEGLPLWFAVGPIVALLIALGGYFMDYPRLYLYAAVLVYGIVQAEFLYDFVGSPFDTLISFGIPGLAILIFGLTLLFGFMKKYPKPTPEASHVG